MFGKFRHVVFSLWLGRCVGLGFGVLWCVPVIYGEAGKVRCDMVSCGRLGLGLFGPGRQGELCLFPFWYVG